MAQRGEDNLDSREPRWHGRSRPGRIGLLGVAALACFLLPACTQFPRDPGLYRKILDEGVPASQPAFDSAEPMPLGRALLIANADNESIASRGEDYVQALAQKMRDAGTFLPTLSLVPAYSLTHQTGQTDHSFTVPLNASATGSLANVSNYQAAGKTIDQRSLLLLDERETILLQVVQSYYSTLIYEHQSQVYESSVKVKSERARDQEARLKLGAVRPLDLAQSQSDLAATRVSLIQARTNASNARSALARLMGVSGVNGPLTDSFVPPDPIPAMEEWQTRANKERQDLLASAQALEAARIRIDGAIHEYYPTVSINFQYFLYNDPSNPIKWTNGISANIPIFSALSIEADIRAAWSQYRQAGLSQGQTMHQVEDDVNQGYRNYINSRDKIAELKVQVAAAQKAFELSERAYQLGASSNLDRLTQQDNLLTAQLELVSEQYNQKSNYLGLLRASGGLSSVLKAERH